MIKKIRNICLVLLMSQGMISMSALKIGDPAPEFQLQDETGTLRSLNDFNGKRIAFYFYPKNNTPGCTKEACGLRDGYAELTKNNIVVVGASYGSTKSNKEFKERYS